MPMPRKDLTGQRFGRLTVIRRHDKVNGYFRWECACDCGTMKIVSSPSLHGGARSCGCLLAEHNKNQKVHGREPKRLYHIWSGMKCRCNDPRNKDFPHYGGRGITVSPVWSDFVQFRDWAFSSGYADNLTLDRIDTNGNYCPQNCRWATPKEQANNRTNNRKISYHGETKNISEWAEHFGIDPSLFHAAIRRGRTMDEIVERYAGERFMREGTAE